MTPQPKLNVYQNRLLSFYREVCTTAADGICRRGTRAISDECAFSVGKVVSTRRELVAMGMITEQHGRGDQPIAVSLCDAASDAPAVQPANESVQDTNGTVHAVNESVHVLNGTVHAVNALAHVDAPAALSSLPDSSSQQKLKSKDKDKKQKPLSPSAKPRRKHPNEDLHHAVVREFGLDPERMTPTADGLYWRVAAELKGVGLPAELVPDLHRFVKRKAREGDWSRNFTPLALSKYAPEFLKLADQQRADQARRAEADRIWREQNPDLYPAGSAVAS